MDVLIQEVAVDMNGQHGIEDMQPFKIWSVIFHREPDLPGIDRPPYWVGKFDCPYCGKVLETEEYEFWTDTTP